MTPSTCCAASGRRFAERLRDNPAVFSYTPAVEWEFPAGNLTWMPPDKQSGRLETAPGLFYWRAFLQARYHSSIAELNRAYGTAYDDFSAVPVVDYNYDPKQKRYADPEAKILDYQDFREWASRRYFKPQIAAIRAADRTAHGHHQQPFPPRDRAVGRRRPVLHAASKCRSNRTWLTT